MLKELLGWRSIAIATLIAFLVWTALVQPPHHEQYGEPDSSAVAPTSSDERVADYTEALAAFTALLAVFTVVLAGASIWQGYITQNSLNLAREEFITTHRPKIVLRRAIFRRTNEGVSEIYLVFANIGAAEAAVDYFKGGWGTKDWVIDRNKPGFNWHEGHPKTVVQALGRGVIASGESQRINLTAGLPISDALLANMASWITRLFITGTVRYRDKAGVIREMGFIRWYHPEYRSFQRLPHEWRDADLEYDD